MRTSKVTAVGYTHCVNRRSLSVLVFAVATALAVVGGACGANSAGAAGGKACATAVRGSEARIRPENSGFSCAEIESILSVLPNAPGVWPIEGEGPTANEVCRVYPRSAYPLEIRCHNGHRRFEVVGVSKRG
jgi:hypothetical protein